MQITCHIDDCLLKGKLKKITETISCNSDALCVFVSVSGPKIFQKPTQRNGKKI